LLQRKKNKMITASSKRTSLLPNLNAGALRAYLQQYTITDEAYGCQLCGQTTKSYMPIKYRCEECFVSIREGMHYFFHEETNAVYCSNKCCKKQNNDLTKIKSKRFEPRILNEPLVPCTFCSRKVHRSCGFVSMRHLTKHEDYTCPSCLLSSSFVPAPSAPSSSFSSLVVFILKQLNEPTLDVQLVHHSKQKNQFAHPVTNVPILFDESCLFIFQTIRGIKTLLFVVWVQYYGESMYISYLDSVNYFVQQSPELTRTQMYQTVILSVFEYSRCTTCFIWSCPPNHNDDYILYCHPPSQKIPKQAKLTAWYIALMERAKTTGIIHKYQSFHDHVCGIQNIEDWPCFYGDFWPNLYSQFVLTAPENAPTAIRKCVEQQALNLLVCYRHSAPAFIPEEAEQNHAFCNSRAVFLNHCIANRYFTHVAPFYY
jgi:hypothetical protein